MKQTKDELKKKLEAAQMANASVQTLLNAMDNDNSKLKSHIARLTSENEKLTDKLNREIIKNKDIKVVYNRLVELTDSREKAHVKDVLKLKGEIDSLEARLKAAKTFNGDFFETTKNLRKELEATKTTAENYRKLALYNYELYMDMKGLESKSDADLMYLFKSDEEREADTEKWRAAWDGENILKAVKIPSEIAEKMKQEWESRTIEFRFV